MYAQIVPNTVWASLTTTARVFYLSSAMPVPWEALIPFGKPASFSLLSSAEFTRSGHRTVRRCWNTVECIQTRTKPGQGESSISISLCLRTHLFYFTPCASSQPPRYHIDSWEEMLMDRDQRLTGHARKQTVRT